MPNLKLTASVKAPIHDVYEYVTLYGQDGPLNLKSFHEHYGEIISESHNQFVIREDVRRYPDDDPELVTWYCSFRYPNFRKMEAVDSKWAHRQDSFEVEGKNTKWTIRWNTHIGGLRGVVQYIIFHLFGHRGIRRDLMNPTTNHFDDIGLVGQSD